MESCPQGKGQSPAKKNSRRDCCVRPSGQSDPMQHRREPQLRRTGSADSRILPMLCSGCTSGSGRIGPIGSEFALMFSLWLIPISGSSWRLLWGNAAGRRLLPNKWDGRASYRTTHTTMPGFKRTRPKVDETDSESDGSPTINKRSDKRTKPTVTVPATDRKLRNSPQKLAVYIVAAKLGANRTVVGLSHLVEESSDYSLAKSAEEADVIITGVGMRKRLERSVSAKLIVR